MFENLFDGELGSEIYSLAESAVRDFSMESSIRGGVLVGLSGGADSVLLLAFLDKFKRVRGLDFHISAFHLNHSIRGSAGETGDLVGRGMILDDGSYHYCLTVLAEADKAAENQAFWDSMFQTFRLA